MASAFKQLYSEMIKNGGDIAKVSGAMGGKKQIKCFVKEAFPFFIVTDNFFYVPCYFTKKAIDDFKSKHKSNVTDLRGQVIILSDWTLEMAKVNSSDNFTSYGNIEVKLIVKAFKVDSSKGQKAPVAQNLYRNDEIKTLI